MLVVPVAFTAPDGAQPELHPLPQRQRFSVASAACLQQVLADAVGTMVRIVAANGALSFRGHRLQVGKAFGGQRVGIVPTAVDGQFRVLFAHQPIARIDLRSLDRTAPRCYPCP